MKSDPGGSGFDILHSAFFIPRSGERSGAC
jgi:hypothetical protein